jgi:hypothetical protein
MRWRPGDPIVRREVWRGRVVEAWAGLIARDDDDLLALWMPSDSPLAFADYLGGPHPWIGRDRRHGPGVLQLQRPGDVRPGSSARRSTRKAASQARWSRRCSGARIHWRELRRVFGSDDAPSASEAETLPAKTG